MLFVGVVDVLLVWLLALALSMWVVLCGSRIAEWLKDERIRISSAVSLRYSILELHAKRDLSSHSHGRIMVQLSAAPTPAIHSIVDM